MTDVTATSSVRSDETRRALLAAAHDLLAGEGPGALSVRRIATAAGMSTMNVYSRFGGKDGVLDELFAEGFRRLSEAMAETPSTDDTLADLRECALAYRRFANEHPTYYSLMFDRVAPDYEPSPAARAEALGALGRLQAKVQRAMDAGAIRPGDAFAVATGLWACQHGLVSLESHNRHDEVFDWATVYPLTSDALVRGLT